MPLSTYERDLHLNGRYRDGGAIAALGTIYLALASADLTAANVSANELPAGNGYARLAIGTTNADWTAPADSGGRRIITNTAALTGATASGDLNGGAPIGFWGLYDAATLGTGNLIRYGAFQTPVTILNGDQIVIAIGSLEIGL